MPGSLALVTPAERILLWQKPHLRSAKAEAPGQQSPDTLEWSSEDPSDPSATQDGRLPTSGTLVNCL